jgi:hypothetical protein
MIAPHLSLAAPSVVLIGDLTSVPGELSMSDGGAPGTTSAGGVAQDALEMLMPQVREAPIPWA